MSETTTTPSGAETTAEAGIIAASQAASTESTTGAEGTTDKNHTDTQSGSETVDTSTTDKGATGADDADLSWLENKGVDVNDPKAVAAAWRKAEQEFHKSKQEAKQPTQNIQQQVTSDDTVQQLDQSRGLDPKVVALERDVAEMRFFMSHPEITAEQRDQATADIVNTAKKHPLLATEFDLETLWAISKSQKVDTIAQTAETRGRQAKAEEIARASAAAIPDGDASGGKKAEQEAGFLKGFNG